MENLTLYTFKREADRALFVPSKTFSGISTWMFVGGASLMLYFSSIFFLHPLGTSGSLWIGAIFVAVAGYSVALAMRSWSTRNTPLSIMSGGRQYRELKPSPNDGVARATEALP